MFQCWSSVLCRTNLLLPLPSECIFPPGNHHAVGEVDALLGGWSPIEGQGRGTWGATYLACLPIDEPAWFFSWVTNYKRGPDRSTDPHIQQHSLLLSLLQIRLCRRPGAGVRKDNDFPSSSCSSSLRNIFLKRSFNRINFISFKHLGRRGIQDMTVNDFLGSEILKGIGSPTMTQKGLLPK